jgi:hypothetical protein
MTIEKRYHKSKQGGRGLLVFFTIQCLLLLFDFFLTANPYSANHSGHSGSETGIVAYSYFIQTNLITAVSIFCAYFYLNKLKLVLPLFPLYFAIWIFFSGTLNHGIFEYTKSYFYDAILPFLLAGIAYHDFRGIYNPEKLRILFWGIFGYVLLGCILALIKPKIWGYLPFAFSRVERGENSLAFLNAAHIMLPAMALSISSLSKGLRLFVFVFMLFLALSVMTRTLIVYSISPLLIYVFIRKKGITSYILKFLALGACYIGFLFLIDSILLSSSKQSVLEASLTGRYELWEYYWKQLWESPFIGKGAFMLASPTSSYRGLANSEIGLLKTATEYGIPAAILQLALVILADISAFRILTNNKSNDLEILTSLLAITLTIEFLIQDHYRILSTENFVFWYSVFFLVFQRYPRLRFRVGI